MKLAGAVCFVLASLPAQSIQVDASGTLMLAWQGSGAMQTQSAPVQGATTLTNAGVGTITLATGVTTTLTLAAASPPWPGPVQGWWSQASADVVVRYSATAPVAGVLRFDVVPACIMGMPPSVDVGDDGLYEVAPSGLPSTVDIPVVLGPRPIPIRLTDTVVNFGATCVSTMTVTFVPQPSQLASTGVPCGSSLAASLLPPSTQPGRLTLHVDDLQMPANVLAAVVFGRTALPLGATCAPGLVVDGSFLRLPTAGGFDFPIPLSAGLVGTLELQYVGLQVPFLLEYSNRVRISLP